MRCNDFVLVVALLFLTCVGGWLSPAPALAQSAEIAVESAAYPPNLKFALGAEAPAALKAQTSKDDVVNRVVLPPPVPDKRQVTPAPKGAPQQIGFARTIPPDDAQQVAAARLRWTSVGSGTWLRSALPRLARPRSACHWHSRACQMELRFGSSVSARMSGYSVHSV